MSSTKPIPFRATFDAVKEKYLVKALLKQSEAGKRADSGWKKEAWTAVVLKFNEKFSGQYTAIQLKNKHDNVSELIGLWLFAEIGFS
jgi:hypothetical protein